MKGLDWKWVGCVMTVRAHGARAAVYAHKRGWAWRVGEEWDVCRTLEGARKASEKALEERGRANRA